MLSPKDIYSKRIIFLKFKASLLAEITGVSSCVIVSDATILSLYTLVCTDVWWNVGDGGVFISFCKTTIARQCWVSDFAMAVLLRDRHVHFTQDTKSKVQMDMGFYRHRLCLGFDPMFSCFKSNNPTLTEKQECQWCYILAQRCNQRNIGFYQLNKRP